MHKESTRYLTRHCVSLLERPTTDILVISWSDARRCHYSEQIWRLRMASVDGQCALSGLFIHTGDQVFKPSAHPSPLNAGEMILQSAVPESVGPDDANALNN
ncbi:DUF3331 domain-containing protein [Caballeronia sp. LjRoot34]|uniref:DUF3331 domain-containing protein n=1 Tax=Caballeronia sp. LjRoot34 TaxID=3342325 RepID=UPI003ECD5F49